MKIISDIISAIRANMKCLWLKVFQPKLLYYNPFLRIQSNVEIRLQGGGNLFRQRCPDIIKQCD